MVGGSPFHTIGSREEAIRAEYEPHSGLSPSLLINYRQRREEGGRGQGRAFYGLLSFGMGWGSSLKPYPLFVLPSPTNPHRSQIRASGAFLTSLVG